MELITDESSVQPGYQFRNARYEDGIKFLKKEKQIDDYRKEDKIRKTIKKKDEIIDPVKSVTDDISINLHVKRKFKEEIIQGTSEKRHVINQKNGAKYTDGIIRRKIDIVDKNSLNGVFKTKKKEKRTIYETNAAKNKEYVKRTGEKTRPESKKRSGKGQEEANGNKKAKSFFKRELKRKILTGMTNGEKKEEDHMSSGIGSLFTASFRQKLICAITGLFKKILSLILSGLVTVLGILLLIIVVFLAVAFIFLVVIFIVIALCQSVVGFFYQDYAPEINTNSAYFGTVFNEKVRGFNNYIQEWNNKTYTVTFTETKEDGTIEVKQEEKHYTSAYISNNDNYADMLTLYLVLVSDYSNLEVLTGEGWDSTNLPYLIVDTETEKEIINKIFNALYYTEVDPNDEHKLLIYKKPASNYLTKYPFTKEQQEVFSFIDDAMKIQIAAGGISDVEAPDVNYDDAIVNKIFEEGNKYLGRKYVYGGSNPNTGFDCSGFVCWVYNKAGASSIGRTTAQGLYNNCTPIRNEADAKPGDLIFFKGTYDCGEVVTHVGIYAGNGTMLHCGDPIQYTSIHSSYWDNHFYSFGRLK